LSQSRVACFIDGFNVYHALMEPDASGSASYARYRWIDYRKLAERYVSPEEELIAVYYFTAYAAWDEAKASRHRTLVSVQKDRGVRVVLGRYRPVTELCRTVCRLKYQTYREKRTDVNIAIQLLNMAYRHAYDRAILISGDSDLVPVIKHARLVHPEGKSEAEGEVALLCHPDHRHRRAHPGHRSPGEDRTSLVEDPFQLHTPRGEDLSDRLRPAQARDLLVVPEREGYTVRRGWNPSARSISTASRIATTLPFVSSVPRPHTNPSAIAPENGRWVQFFSVPGSTGTTSRCPMRRTGGSEGSLPSQV